MIFSINQIDLVNVLQKIQAPASFRQNFPILNCILIESYGNKIKFTTTDLDVTIISYCEGNVEEPGKIAVPAKRFIPIIRELPKKEITLETVNNNLLIRCEKIEFKINCMDPQEFPQIEEEKRKVLIKVDPADLLEMIRLTSFSVGVDEVNYVLNGILFEIYGDKISLVSTDGKRLSHIVRNLPPQQPEINKKIEFILPIKSVNEIFKLIKEKEEVFIFTEKKIIGFDLKDTLFMSKPIEGEFPDYSQYIPPPTENKLTINRKEFLASLRRAELLSAPDYQGVKIELKKEEIIIYKSTPQLGEVKESLDANYTGPHLEIGFNPSYLIDVLKNIEEERVSFEIYGIDKPAVLRLNNYICLILPMRL